MSALTSKNNALLGDLLIPAVTELASQKYKRLNAILRSNENPLISRMLSYTILRNYPKE